MSRLLLPLASLFKLPLQLLFHALFLLLSFCLFLNLGILFALQNMFTLETKCSPPGCSDLDCGLQGIGCGIFYVMELSEVFSGSLEHNGD